MGFHDAGVRVDGVREIVSNEIDVLVDDPVPVVRDVRETVEVPSVLCPCVRLGGGLDVVGAYFQPPGEWGG